MRKAVETLPTTLHETYDEVMRRIASQEDGDAWLGRKVLSWISYAKRPLTVAEIQHAVSVEPHATGISEEDLTSKDILVSVCAGIVTVDQGGDIIRLVHYTAQEYFLKKRSIHFQNAEQEIAITCLTYLSFDNFREGYCETYEALESLLEENPLLDYAARHWADHAREVTEVVMESARKFLKEKTRTSLAFQVMVIHSRRYPPYSQNPSKDMLGLHLCAYLGLHGVTLRMLEMPLKVDVVESSGRTPLSWAAEQGHEAVARLLLDKGATVDAADTKSGQTPLSWAAKGGHHVVVRFLLNKGAEIDARNKYGQTPLWCAARNKHDTVVRLLLDKGAKVEAKDDNISS